MAALGKQAYTPGDKESFINAMMPHAIKVSEATGLDPRVVIAQAALDTGAWLRLQLGARPVLLCASTRDGEEELILAAFKRMPGPKPLLLIVPRHPQRFDEVAALIADFARERAG